MDHQLPTDDFLNQVDIFFNKTPQPYPRLNFKVKDFMRTDYVTLKENAKLSDAIKIIVENNIDNVPIVDDDDGIIGVITRKLVLRKIHQGESLNTYVRHIMKTNPKVTTTDENILPLLKISISSIPVVENNRIAGLVTRANIVRACFSSMLMLNEGLQKVLYSTHSGIISVDNELNIQLINASGEKMLNLSSRESVGSPLQITSLALIMKEVMENGQPVYSKKFFSQDKILIANISRLELQNEIFGAVAMIQDISDFESISEELESTKQLKNELDTIIESSYDGIAFTDNVGKTLRVNDAFVRITGVKRERVINKTIRELYESGVYLCDIPLGEVLKGKSSTFVQEDFAGHHIMTTSNPIADSQKNIFRIVHNIRDITELERTKKRLEQARSESQHYKEQLQIVKSKKYIAKSQKSKDLIKLIMNLSKIDATVLLLGESGVGKDVLAEMLHENSPRKDRPMISINCAAIPENLMESELFGYESGAFTGANKKGNSGAFEIASGGTLFLDEIGEMPLPLQSKLLRAIQKKEITKLGGHRPTKIDVRIIAATNRDLMEMVAQKLFRQDLYYRLNVVPITIPPLRERKEEIPDLVLHFTRLFNNKYNSNKRFDESVFPQLLKYDWPGNIRELENVIERGMITSSDDLIDHIELIGFNTQESPESRPVYIEGMKYKPAMEHFEKEMIQKAIQKCSTTRKAAAELGISQSALVRKAAKYKLNCREDSEEKE